MYGPGIDWAGSLVEQASGTRLDEYFRKHLLQPLGIDETEISFFPVKEGLGDRMPDLNPKDPRGVGLMAGMGRNVHGEDGLTTCFGGQGAYASCEAYISILHSILSNDGKLLRKETVNAMFSPQLEPVPLEALAAVLEGPIGIYFNNGTSGKDSDFGLGGLLVGQDEADAGLGKGSVVWGGGVSNIWHLDRANGICGFASQQLGYPPDSDKAHGRKGIIRRELKRRLSPKSS